ncbi:RNA polymerase sigma factor [Paludisphaera rhizosphaerae]|uniref:RNA polymerase sigma factor n=1 Tax=Paludisphaera rhizosphaerae TaxID=2711216 RepID=UPI0013EBEBEB|nr:sigma-70 family RNA polymerase sigma factor [Paludisphaera rhizosphaerae]
MGHYDDDSRLLADFLEKSDPEAFAALVARFGPPVLRICRTILPDRHLAEDAFQSTFLTLYQKAGNIRDPSALRAWICGTAYKTAARIRAGAIRRAKLEKGCDLDQTEGQASFVDVSDHDLFLVVRKELDRLPAKYRAPIILCYLEGLTHEQAAAELGWATGTVKVRLVRGRKLLRERLDRRKIALAAGLIGLWSREAGAADPSLITTTLNAAKRSARISALCESPRVLDHRSVTRLVLVLVLACAAVSAARAMSAVGAPPEDAESTLLPTNLTDLLNSDCS